MRRSLSFFPYILVCHPLFCCVCVNPCASVFLSLSPCCSVFVFLTVWCVSLCAYVSASAFFMHRCSLTPPIFADKRAHFIFGGWKKRCSEVWRLINANADVAHMTAATLEVMQRHTTSQQKRTSSLMKVFQIIDRPRCPCIPPSEAWTQAKSGTPHPHPHDLHCSIPACLGTTLGDYSHSGKTEEMERKTESLDLCHVFPCSELMKQEMLG